MPGSSSEINVDTDCWCGLVIACNSDAKEGSAAQRGATTGATTGATATGFDGNAAYNYAKAQVDFGPRVPGTPAAKQAGDWIIRQMRARADTVIVQSFTHTTASGKKLPMRNILARFRPELTERVLYVTHWDSRPVSESAVYRRREKNAGAGGERRRVGCRPVRRSRRRAEEDQAECRRGSAVHRRRGLRRVRPTRSGRPDRLEVFRLAIFRRPATSRSTECCGT